PPVARSATPHEAEGYIYRPVYQPIMVSGGAGEATGGGGYEGNMGYAPVGHYGISGPPVHGYPYWEGMPMVPAPYMGGWYPRPLPMERGFVQLPDGYYSRLGERYYDPRREEASSVPPGVRRDAGSMPGYGYPGAGPWYRQPVEGGSSGRVDGNFGHSDP